MILDEDTNAVARFQAEVVDESSDSPYGDADTDWVTMAAHRVYHETRGVQLVSQSTGDVVERQERIFAPLDIDTTYAINGEQRGIREADRIEIETDRGRIHRKRIDRYDVRVMGTPASDGYVQIELQDWHD